MIIIRFGRWSDAADSRLVYSRIFLKGYKWTPFVRVRRRYTNAVPEFLTQERNK